jgi:hypothetical protein
MDRIIFKIMSIIKQPLLYVGSKSEARLYTLFDSGANLSCISEDYACNLATVERLVNVRRIATASHEHFIEIKERVLLDFYINDVQLSDEFLVVPGLSEEAIIGAATMQKWRIKLDFKEETVDVNPKVAKMQI